MRLPWLAVATTFVRGWTRLYTWHMPTAQREARRAEIESDLWESRQDLASRRPFSLAFHMLLRLLFGMPDDLSWRMEHTVFSGVRAQRTIGLTAVAVFVLAIWWISASRQLAVLPPLPASKLVEQSSFILPPPPPPPPPGGRR
jgi:hypothetical protein